MKSIIASLFILPSVILSAQDTYEKDIQFMADNMCKCTLESFTVFDEDIRTIFLDALSQETPDNSFINKMSDEQKARFMDQNIIFVSDKNSQKTQECLKPSKDLLDTYKEDGKHEKEVIEKDMIDAMLKHKNCPTAKLLAAQLGK